MTMTTTFWTRFVLCCIVTVFARRGQLGQGSLSRQSETTLFIDREQLDLRDVTLVEHILSPLSASFLQL